MELRNDGLLDWWSSPFGLQKDFACKFIRHGRLSDVRKFIPSALAPRDEFSINFLNLKSLIDIRYSSVRCQLCPLFHYSIIPSIRSLYLVDCLENNC